MTYAAKRRFRSAANRVQPLALTLGDPAGIGPEITWKAWERLRSEPDLAFGVIAPAAALKTPSRATHPIRLIADIAEAKDVFADALPVLDIEGQAAIPGHADPIHAETITQSIQRAVSLALNGTADAVVTNPIAKDVLYRAGFSFPGHTEYLGSLCADVAPPYHAGPVMMLSAPDAAGNAHAGEGDRQD